MYEIAFKPRTQREDFEYLGELIDDDDGSPLDISAMTMVFQISDHQGWRVLQATIANGRLTLIDINKFKVFIPASDMHSLCPGTYNTGLTLTNEDASQTKQISIGPLPIDDGVVP